jgi:hypothetical protein
LQRYFLNVWNGGLEGNHCPQILSYGKDFFGTAYRQLDFLRAEFLLIGKMKMNLTKGYVFLKSECHTGGDIIR